MPLIVLNRNNASGVHTPPSVLYFLHIPKCGGTSVAHLLREAMPGCVREPTLTEKSDITHCLLSHVADRYDYSFSIVRHPITWYESWWRYVLSPKVADRPNTLDSDGKPSFDTWVGEGVWHPLRPIAKCHDASFPRFIRNVIEAEPGFVSAMYDQYLGFSKGCVNVDFILKLEHLHRDFKSLCRATGFPAVTVEKHENKSDRSFHTEWPRHLKDKVLELERPCLEFFDYA